MKWIYDNKEWIFSGVGITLIGAIIKYIFFKEKSLFKAITMKVTNINMGSGNSINNHLSNETKSEHNDQ